MNHPDKQQDTCHAWVQPRLSETAIIGALKDHIANFKVRKRVFFVAELARDAMGKVQNARLREMFAAR